MMGHSHAISGALVWLAVAPAGAAVVGQPLSLAQVAAGTITCAGAALLPDLDHPSATISRTFGPLSQALARWVAYVSGGHRQGTHSIAFCIGAGLATWALISWAPPMVTSVIMWLLIGLGMRGLSLASRGSGMWTFLVNGGISAGIVWLINNYMPQEFTWLWVAIILGSISHLLGDLLTPEGVPAFAPATKRRFSIPIIPHTSHWLETAVFAPAMGILSVFLLIRQAQPQWDAVYEKIPFV